MKQFNLKEIEEIIGYKFQDQRLIVQALTHSSYANENADLSYERLEFLGDSILGHVISAYLFEHYPDEDEGFLTKTKAKIVSGKNLSSVMNEMGLIKYVRTAQGSIEEEVLKSSNVKEDIFESIIGAIMLDSNSQDECEKYILKHLEKSLKVDYLKKDITDFKSKLLEYSAKRHDLMVEFKVRPLGDNINGGFEAVVLINGVRYGSGEGVSKKKAEQLASKRTLDMLRL